MKRFAGKEKTMKRIVTFVLVGMLSFGVLGQSWGAPKPATLWKDDAGDADNGQGLGGSIPLGWDLAAGTVVRKGKNLEFTVTHHDMPPTGTAPEVTRFLWNFTVDGTPYRFTVKSVDIGKPDVFAGQTTERVGRVDLQGHFRLEGECVTEPGVGISFVNCPPLEYLEGTWDPAAMSFTVILPLKSVKAKPGSVIGPGGENICTICWVAHHTERSLDATAIDTALQAKSWKVPK